MSIKMHMPPLASVRGQTLLTDTKPYLYRQSPVVAEMLDDMLTGGTVAWNQLWNQPNTLTAPAGVNTGSLGVAYNIPFVSGHKYLQCVKQNTTMTSNTRNTLVYNDGANHFQVTNPNNHLQAGDMYWVFSASASTNSGSVWVWAHTPNVDVSYSGFGLFDLTQMFGSTIADYVYSLEQSTAGSGIAWLKSFGFFTEDYYPYDAGSLLSVKTSGHKTVGKNLLDLSQWTYEQNSGFSVNGDTILLINSGYQENKNSYTLLFKTACVFSFHVKTIALNDSRAAFAVYINGQKKVGTGTDQFGNIGLVAVDNETDVSISIPNTATVISFGGWSYTGQVEISKLQLEFGNTATSYEAPFSHTYPLSDIELRGIPKLTDGQLYYDGDTYASDGTVTRKYGIRAYQAGDESLADAVTDGTNTVYKLVAPTTETTDAFTNPQQAGTTEEYIDERTVPMPVGHTTEYFNMEQKEQIQMHTPTHSPIKMHMPKGSE